MTKYKETAWSYRCVVNWKRFSEPQAVLNRSWVPYFPLHSRSQGKAKRPSGAPPRRQSPRGTREWEEDVVVFVGRDIGAGRSPPSGGRVSVAARVIPRRLTVCRLCVGREAQRERRLFLTFSFLPLFPFLFRCNAEVQFYLRFTFTFFFSETREMNDLVYLFLRSIAINFFLLGLTT